MFLGESGAFGGDGVADAAVDPGRVVGLVGDVDSDSLFMGGDVIITPSRFNIVAKESGAIPGGFLLDEGETDAVGAIENHSKFAVLRDNIGERIIHGDIGGVGSLNASLHGGDTDGDIRDVATDKIDDSSETGGSTGKS